MWIFIEFLSYFMIVLVRDLMVFWVCMMRFILVSNMEGYRYVFWVVNCVINILFLLGGLWNFLGGFAWVEGRGWY